MKIQPSTNLVSTSPQLRRTLRGVLVGALLLTAASGQTQPPAQPKAAETAKAFIREGDYQNAILVLNRALETDPSNVELKKDLAFAFYLQKNYTRSLEIIRPVVESVQADVQAYQIMALNLKARDEGKAAETLYKNGLRRFPKSGVLHSEFGEMLWSRQAYTEAATVWQQGIRADPQYPGNYYHAARYFYMSPDKVRGLIYGEIFINLESYSRRTPEIKALLLEGYKKLFSEVDLTKGQDVRNPFIQAYLTTLQRHGSILSGGVTPHMLTALRTRFLLDWFDNHARQFPLRLFDLHRQLAREGLFDAYNQWIFGAADDLPAFQRWTANHADAYQKFLSFQKGRVFQVGEGQQYF